MAIDTAPAHRPAPRNYWQLPTFVLGVAAAVASIAAFPPPPTDPAAKARDEVTALRSLLERRPVDMATLEPAIRRIAADSLANADAHFLAGSGFVLLSEYGSSDTANEFWAAADQEFAKVDSAQFTDPTDAKRLAYRHAKAAVALGKGNADILFPVLNNPPVGEDEGGERTRLLAEACLKLNPPDLKRARTELTTYLGAPNRQSPTGLAKLKLQLATIHTALNEPDKARTWLKDIGTGAAPETLAAARVQLAKLAAQEKNWPETIQLYEAALATPGLPAEDRSQIQYLIGVSQVRLKNLTAAAPYFQQALTGPPAVAAASAVRLADLNLQNPDNRGRRADTVNLLETALRGGVSTNPQVPIQEVQAVFEQAVQVCLREADFATAVRAATLYGAVATPGRDKERRAEANMAWAVAIQSAGGDSAKEAVGKLMDAAADYTTLSETYPTPAGKSDLLRRAAECFRKAGDRSAATAALDKAVSLSGLPPDAAAGAWLDKGDLLYADHKYPEAEAALQKAIATAGPIAGAARVKLALVYLEQARTKLRTATTPGAQAEAKKQLEFGQELLAQVANKTTEHPIERDAQQQALYELGKLLVQQLSFADADARFRQLIQLNPTGPFADQSRLWLGSCLLQIARGDFQGGTPPADADRKLAEAQQLFEQLSTSADPYLRTQADIRLANTTLLLKKYDEMPALCDRLAQKYRGKVEELIVLSMLYSAQRYADRSSDAARTLSRMEEVFGRLQPADFTGGREEYTREYWQQQWFDVLKK